MKKIPSFAILLASVVFLSSALSHGQVYSWVDEKGKTHYGDRIPEKYKGQASEMKLGDVNEMQPVEAQPRRRPTSDARPQVRSIGRGAKATANTADMSCEEKKQAYREAERCFADCSINVGRAGVNVTHCEHCRDMQKPDWDC